MNECFEDRNGIPIGLGIAHCSQKYTKKEDSNMHELQEPANSWEILFRMRFCASNGKQRSTTRNNILPPLPAADFKRSEPQVLYGFSFMALEVLWSFGFLTLYSRLR